MAKQQVFKNITGANICNSYGWQKVNNSNIPKAEKLVRKTHHLTDKLV